MPGQGGNNGIVIGVVKSLEDPESLGRVQVGYPHLGGTRSGWARLVSLMAGAGRGAFFRPEVDDEVLVAFEHGDLRRPYVLGALWSAVDKPPADDGKSKQNNWRFIRSRSGHLLKFDDTKGKERIELIDREGKRRLVIDCEGSRIEISADAGDVLVRAGQGNVAVEAPQAKVSVVANEIVATAQTKASVDAAQIELKAKADITIEAKGVLALKGATVMIN
jgi:uncharacterized protein involved in type VI secretion and phage assembly